MMAVSLLNFFVLKADIIQYFNFQDSIEQEPLAPLERKNGPFVSKKNLFTLKSFNYYWILRKIAQVALKFGHGIQTVLAQTMRGHHILYPIATHHMLEDLDTMWNLWYTHKLPLKWWLEDRSEDICHDLMDRGPSKNSKIW